MAINKKRSNQIIQILLIAFVIAGIALIFLELSTNVILELELQETILTPTNPMNITPTPTFYLEHTPWQLDQPLGED